MRHIWRNPFARASGVRRHVARDFCANCGRSARYQYGVLRDDRTLVDWYRRIFCSVSCLDQYYDGDWSRSRGR